MNARREGHGKRRQVRSFAPAAVLLFATMLSRPVGAQEAAQKERGAVFVWNEQRTELSATFGYRDVVDATIRRKLSRGLPTTIVLTGTLYRTDSGEPLSTTAQTCKITWHVWNEAYRLDITRPEGSSTRWTPTLEGVLRRCAEVHELLVATSAQVGSGVPVRLEGSVQVNPVSEEVLNKIKRWVSRPIRTGTAAPGDALFSTFTGLFMRRVGEAERKVDFTTPAVMPAIKKEAPRNEG